MFQKIKRHGQISTGQYVIHVDKNKGQFNSIRQVIED